MLHKLAERHPTEFGKLDSTFDKWALAQHYDFKTRFLDITEDLLVALFWACQGGAETDGRLHVFIAPHPLVQSSDTDIISTIANFARLHKDEQDLLLGRIQTGNANTTIIPDRYFAVLEKLYQLIKEEKPHFERQIDIRDLYKVFVVKPRQPNERLRVQSGAFLVSAFHERLERDEILSKNRRTSAYNHYILPVLGKHKASILEELRLQNITREKLLPELDSSADVVTERYSQRRQQDDG